MRINLRLAAASVAFSLALVLWVYGVYCYVQMVRHRRPGTSPLALLWPAERLTAQGRRYRRRALGTYGIVVALLILVYVFGHGRGV